MKKAMKRIVLLALALMLAAAPALAASTATTTAGSLNVRAGVGTDYKVLQALPKNTEVYYLGVSDVDDGGNIWYKVQYGAYATGWVSAKYCTIGSTVTNSYVEANSGSTNIRSNPNLDGSKIGVMPKGGTATYLGQICTDIRGVDWFYVNYNGTIGWVSTMYTYLYSESVPGLSFLMPNLPDYGAASGTVKAENGSAYIRDAANLNGNALTVLEKGVSATYLNERSVDERGVVWFRVNYNGAIGWISSRYAMLYGNVPAAQPKDYIIGTGGDSNVRKTPSLDGAYMGVLEQDEKVPYLGESSIDSRGVIWYKVNFEGSTGWISSMYASLNGKTTSYGTAFGYSVKATATTNVRREPILDGKILSNMVEDEVATFTGETSTDNRGVVWYRVNFEGTSGWVSSKYTQLQ